MILNHSYTELIQIKLPLTLFWYSCVIFKSKIDDFDIISYLSYISLVTYCTIKRIPRPTNCLRTKSTHNFVKSAFLVYINPITLTFWLIQIQFVVFRICTIIIVVFTMKKYKVRNVIKYLLHYKNILLRERNNLLFTYKKSVKK